MGGFVSGAAEAAFAKYEGCPLPRARPALTAHRAVIHYRAPSNPPSYGAKKGWEAKPPILFSRLGGFEPTTYRFVAGHSIH